MTAVRPPAITNGSCSLKQALNRLGETLEQAAPRSSMRPAPANDNQPDFFVPSLYDIPVKDGVDLMDVAVFRLSKRHQRKGDVLRYQLHGAQVEVTAGGYGMASVWDYDLVLMCISHLAEAVRRHRDGKGKPPTRTFRPHVKEVLKFCRLSDGGQQYEAVEKSLDRLKNTTVKITRTNRNAKLRATAGFGLIETYKVISRTDTGCVSTIEIVIPEWIYEAVVTHDNPQILTVNPDYFLIDKGLARFVYRLARKSAGTDRARYLFKTIYERSGSAASFKEFCRMMRQIVVANDLPDFHLAEEVGKDGPILCMTARALLARVA